MDRIATAIISVLTEQHPMTVRQVFYALTTRGVIGKTEQEYKGLVIRLLTKLRVNGVVPFGWIGDNTRWMRRPRTYTGAQQAIEHVARTYRRSLWADAPVYVEVWCEKDALAGVLMEETVPYDVPLMVSRGFSSVTFLHSAAEAIAAQGKPAYIYQFGDHDPSGVAIPQAIEARLRQFAPKAEIHFERVAVTVEQIEEWNLPSRPTKATDTRARNFTGDSVELDAIPPDKLRELVSDCIEQHVDHRVWNAIYVAEESERAWLKQFVATMQGGTA